MKKIITSFFLIYIFSNCFALQKKDFAIQLNPSFGVMFGRASEFVHLDYPIYQGIEDYNEKLSQLDYDFVFPCFSLDLDSKLFKYLYLGGRFSFGIPMKVGIMQDYDWLNVSYFPNSEYKNALTNYSIHDNYLNSFLDMSLFMGWYFDLPCDISLVPFIGISYDFISFTAKNGYGKYGIKKENYIASIFESYSKLNFDGPVIYYEQYSSNRFAGKAPTINFGFNYFITIKSKLCIDGTFLFLPFYRISSYDFHMLREGEGGTDFLSVVSKSFKFSTNVKITYSINKVFSLGLLGNFTIIPQMTGVTYSKDHNEQNYRFVNNTQSRIARMSGKVSFVVGLSF